MTIAIIDYEAGNLHSIISALNKITNKKHSIIKDGNQNEADVIILPGVGSFDQAMLKLKTAPNLIPYIIYHIKAAKKFLGICVGMQILANIGYENGSNSGLGVIEGEVKKIPSSSLKIPHIGWNNIAINHNSSYSQPFKEFDNKDFYFVHSYYFSCKNTDNIVASANYGVQIPAIIATDNVVATQFHPEKSGEAGLEFLKLLIN